jgi:hypothetical protein
MNLRELARSGELFPTFMLGVLDRIGRPLTPARGPEPETVSPDGRDPQRRFSKEQMGWMTRRAGGQCECPACTHTAGADGTRCMALVEMPGVQFQGDHLVSWDEGGATDPVLNGAALCVVCNGKKSNREFTTDELVAIARNRRTVSDR